MNTREDAVARHAPKGWARFEPEIFRAAVAEDRRIRRQAERLGLKARRNRAIGGWSLICTRSGGPIVERVFTWQVAEQLEQYHRSPEARAALECLRGLMECNKILSGMLVSEVWL